MLKTAVSIVAAIAILLTYSAATNFSHWPWTSSREIRQGQVLGFAIGQTKEAAFRNAIDQQHDATITALRLLDAPPTTYDEKFKGFDLKPEDLHRVLPFDRWYVAISGRNAWLELTFEHDRIARIVEKTYRGPTV